MSHGGGHGQHHSKTMKHRYMNHHAIGGGKVHTVADIFTVVHHIVVREHNTLGEAGGSRGILHVADIMFVEGKGATVNFLDGDFSGQNHGFIPGQASIL